MLTRSLSPLTCRQPRHFQFDKSGQWLLVANQDSNTCAVFQFNNSTGEVRASLPTPALPSALLSATPSSGPRLQRAIGIGTGMEMATVVMPRLHAKCNVSAVKLRTSSLRR